MMLGQKTVVLVAKPFVFLITIIPSTFVAENRLAIVPFAANDAFRIMEITFTPRQFLLDRSVPSL